MPVHDLTARFVANGRVRLAWRTEPPGAAVRVYRDGSPIAETTARTLTVPSGTGRTPTYEVLTAGQTPDTHEPAGVWLVWQADPSVAKYRVRHRVDGGAWRVVADLTPAGLSEITWHSGPLEDDRVHEFAVATVSDGGTEGQTTARSLRVVRRPDVPAVTFAYDPVSGVVTAGGAD